MEKEFVTISKEKYTLLYQGWIKLCALEAHNVDKWEGYDIAMKEFYFEVEVI